MNQLNIKNLLQFFANFAGFAETKVDTEKDKASFARRQLCFSKYAEKIGKKQKFETMSYVLKNGSPVMYDTDTMTAIATLNGVECALPEGTYVLADGGTLDVKDFAAPEVIEPVIEEVMAENPIVVEQAAADPTEEEEKMAAESLAQFQKVVSEHAKFAAEIEKFKAEAENAKVEAADFKTKHEAALKINEELVSKYATVAGDNKAKPETGEKSPEELKAEIKKTFSKVKSL